MSEQRQVTVYEWHREPNTGTHGFVAAPYEKRAVGIGTFVQYGTDYQEMDHGTGNFTTAIVEMKDGTVVNVQVELIKFDKEKAEPLSDLTPYCVNCNSECDPREVDENGGKCPNCGQVDWSPF